MLDLYAAEQRAKVLSDAIATQQELLGLRLLTLHNLRFLLDLTASARSALCAGRLADFNREALGRLAGEAEEALCHPDS